MRSKKSKPVIAITLGDVAGIGPEVIRKALASGALDRTFEYEVVLGTEAPKVAPGKLSAVAARFALRSLEAALKGIQSGRYCGVVTGPVNKTALSRVGFRFAGQTEWFAARTRTRRYAMLLAGGKLRVALVSTHLSLANATRAVTAAKIMEVARLTYDFLRRLGIRKPQIAVAGLNPHAGENGLIGKEEMRIISPTVQRLRRLGIDAAGPLSPDTVFYQAAKGRFDAVVCMYHDQGLIPLKLLAFDTGVNVTLGLPFPRTSPDHGTAYDIAGRRTANPRSMIEAIKLACVLAKKINYFSGV